MSHNFETLEKARKDLIEQFPKAKSIKSYSKGYLYNINGNVRIFKIQPKHIVNKPIILKPEIPLKVLFKNEVESKLLKIENDLRQLTNKVIQSKDFEKVYINKNNNLSLDLLKYYFNNNFK